MDLDVRWRRPSQRQSLTELPFPKRYAMPRNTPGRRSSTPIARAWDNSCPIDCSGPGKKSPRMKKLVNGLYAITPELPDSSALVRKVGEALAGGAQVIQYRSKSTDMM